MQFVDEQITPQIVNSIKERYFTVKLEIKTHNIGNEHSTYYSCGIFEVFLGDNPSNITSNAMKTANMESMTQVKF